MDYLYYVLAVLVVGLVCFNVIRFATRSRNPDLLQHSLTRRQSASKTATSRKAHNGLVTGANGLPAIKSLRDRHIEKTHHRTPWGWPGAERANTPQGVSQAMRSFTDRLMKEKQLAQPGGNGSIRALLEDRYGPVSRGMTEIPYEKVKRPLLRDPSEPFDQLDNLGSAESRRLRQKMQFLSAMNNVEVTPGDGGKNRKKVEFRYVELKDLKQPWGW